MEVLKTRQQEIIKQLPDATKKHRVTYDQWVNEYGPDVPEVTQEAYEDRWLILLGSVGISIVVVTAVIYGAYSLYDYLHAR